MGRRLNIGFMRTLESKWCGSILKLRINQIIRSTFVVSWRSKNCLLELQGVANWQTLDRSGQVQGLLEKWRGENEEVSWTRMKAEGYDFCW